MHLQKLKYLAHGWTLAVTGRPLIEDRFEAWEYGPVVRKLYDALRTYGPSPIRNHLRWGQDTPFTSDDGGPAFERLEPNEERVLDRVWELYGRYEAFQLSALTHAAGSPWQLAFSPEKPNRQIDNEKIADFFSELADRG
jgi:uncharacterized phage-associated protein